MEVKTNSYYKAVYILCFIFASLMVFVSLFGLLGVSMSNEIFMEIYQASIEQGDTPEVALAYAQSIKTFTYIIFVYCIICSGFTFAEGGIFLKLSQMDNKQAYEKYNFALAWTIVSFFFCGLLIFGLALAGLLAVQRKQREQYLAEKVDVPENAQTQTNNTVSGPSVSEAKVSNEPDLSLENMEKVRERLVKLQEIKELGAINDEEYERIRSEIMSSLNPKNEVKEEPVVTVDPVAEKKAKRIAKLEELKACGAISEEEYAKLKEKVENEQ